VRELAGPDLRESGLHEEGLVRGTRPASTLRYRERLGYRERLASPIARQANREARPSGADGCRVLWLRRFGRATVLDGAAAARLRPSVRSEDPTA